MAEIDPKRTFRRHSDTVCRLKDMSLEGAEPCQRPLRTRGRFWTTFNQRCNTMPL